MGAHSTPRGENGTYTAKVNKSQTAKPGKHRAAETTPTNVTSGEKASRLRIPRWLGGK
jgi:hypothetical protein